MGLEALESNNFGKNVFRLITERGMSQRELAEKAGITEASMSRYINGERIPRVYNAFKIAEILGVRLDELLR